MKPFHTILVLLMLSYLSRGGSGSAVLMTPLITPIGEQSNVTYADATNEYGKCLIKGSNRDRAPKTTAYQPLDVYIQTRVHHIEMDEMHESMYLRGILDMEWDDYDMTCDNETLWKSWVDAGGKDSEMSVHINSYQVWTPDPQLMNSAASANERSLQSWWTKIMVTAKRHSSRVRQASNVQLHFTCAFDFQDFPHDTQTCGAMIRLPYTYDDVILKTSDATILQTDWLSGEALEHFGNWKIVTIWQNVTYLRNNTIQNDIPNDNSGHVTCIYNLWVRVKRHQPHHHVMITVPALLCTACTLVALWLTNVMHASLVLAGSILLQVMNMRHLERMVPQTADDAPSFVTYLELNLLWSMALLVLLHLIHSISTCELPWYPLLDKVLPWAEYMPGFESPVVQGKKDDEDGDNEEELASVDKAVTSAKWMGLGSAIHWLVLMVVPVMYLVLIVLTLR